MTTTTTIDPSPIDVAAFDAALLEARQLEVTPPERYVDGRLVVWSPQPGSQVWFLQCPIFEVLLHGTRGGGKSDALLMSFAQYVARGHGPAWRGVIFRQTYPQLADLVAKSERWFRMIFPGAEFNRARMEWAWPGGEVLMFRHLARPEDYWCVDEGDVLTARGWVPIEDVEIGESVLTCDPQTRRLEWLPVASRTQHEHNGPILRYRGRGCYMSFTEGHKLVTAQGALVRYRDLPREAEIMFGGWGIERPGIESFELPGKSATLDKSPARLSGDDFCELMGWWVAEGWAARSSSKNARKHVCGIAQKNQRGRDMIRALLDRIGFRYQETPGGFIWRSRRWCRWLRQFGGSAEKHVPKEILEKASSGQLRIFLDAFLDGDGTWQGERAYAFTSSRKLADDLTTIGVLLGYAPHVFERQREGRSSPSLQVAFNPRTARRIYTDNRERKIRKLSNKTQVTREHHSGLVYCLGFERNHTFFLRQRGSVWLSGNSYHGHELPFIGWEELTTWPNDECYRLMFSCCRSSIHGVPRMIRSTTNPYGVGHNWVKERFRLHGRWRKTIVITDAVDIEKRPEPPRTAIHSHVDENRILLAADPKYKTNITAAARNESMAKAWLDGSWDVVAGGMFSDVWSDRNVVPAFAIPATWRMDRAFDWGSSRPFSVGWYAKSDGSDLVFPDGRVMSTVRGDLFRVQEWYGWTGHANEGLRILAVDVAKGIVERELAWGWRNRQQCLVHSGIADAAIFAVENGNSIATDMAKPVRIGNDMYQGLRWTPSDKRPGSRKVGWELMRKMIRNARGEGGRPREAPGLFVVGSRCTQFLRTVLSLPRDEDDLDDVDTEAEDHCLDGATLVATHRGPQRIDRMQETGTVLTPVGWSKYERCGRRQSGAECVEIDIDGRRLICTPDHALLGPDGWHDATQSVDELSYALPPWMSSSSRTRFRNLRGSGTTDAGPTFSERGRGSTDRFGNTTAGRSLSGMLCITKTETARTTRSGICDSCHFPITLPTIALTGTLLRRVRRHYGEQLAGMARKLVVSGIDSSTRRIAVTRSCNVCARPVRTVPSSSMACEDGRSTARTLARRQLDEPREWTTKTATAVLVAKLFGSTGTRRHRTVRAAVLARARSVRSAGKRDVYCLKVPGVGAFVLGNGLVVANCGDEVRYRVRGVGTEVRSGTTTGII